MTFCEAVAREEGFGVVGSRPTRNNNPGNINWGAFAQAHGATGIEKVPPGHLGSARFAVFPDAVTGFAAMKALFQVKGVFLVRAGQPRKLLSGYQGATIAEALNRYAPPADDNDTSAYVQNVCCWTGYRSDECIDGIL